MPGTITIKGGISGVIKNDDDDNLIILAGGSKSLFMNGSGSLDAAVVYTGSRMRTIDKITGIVQEKSVKDGVERIRRAVHPLSASISSSQITFQQTATAAYITVSGSNPGMNIIETDKGGTYSRWRSNQIGFISGSGELWAIGQNGDGNFCIGNGLVPGSNIVMEIGDGSADRTTTFNYDVSVTGTLSATRKEFVINHPDIKGKTLHHGSLEGPEFGVYVRGEVKNDDKVQLPNYWGSLVDNSTISVHITPIGRHILPLYFKKIENDCVYVNKKSNFYYYICGERKDINKLKIIQ